MADNWYYVQKGNRQGPVEVSVITTMIANQELKSEDFVWKKGFENWKKIKEVEELQVSSGPELVPEPIEEFPAAPEVRLEEKEFSFISVTDHEERSMFIRVGNDRGEVPADYGPFSLNQIKRLFKENRINGKSFLFQTGMKEWKVLAEISDYQEVFLEQPPVLKDTDRRTTTRKPFIARLFVQNNKKLFEGLCHDISVGGMQILVDDFKGLAGDKISINVHPENSDYHFTAAGVVVRILEGNAGFSFRFNDLNAEAKAAIDKYLSEN